MQTLKINAAEKNKGERLDKFIADNSDISRSYAAKLCEDGFVLCGEKQLLKKYKILGTEEITINVPEPEELSIEPENIPLNIVYEDSDVIVVNKPQGLCVHPAPGNESGTLVNGLVYHCGDELSAINGVIRPGIVHRIDKDTSGLLIVAKNNEAHLKLSEQLKERKAMRKYVALVNGHSGIIAAHKAHGFAFKQIDCREDVHALPSLQRAERVEDAKPHIPAFFGMKLRAHHGFKLGRSGERYAVFGCGGNDGIAFHRCERMNEIYAFAGIHLCKQR